MSGDSPTLLAPPAIPSFLFLFLLISISSCPCLAILHETVRPELLEALLAESLRLYQVQSCQEERVTLQCPRNTHISPQNSFYGRLVPSKELCPARKGGGPTRKWTTGEEEDTSCDFAEAHSRIVELCRGKRKCRLWVRDEFFGERDPCPGTSKYLQLGYKCSPVSFDDQNFCEGQQVQLGCKPGRRLSIYSANYGRTVNGQAMQCRKKDEAEEQKSAVEEDCVSDVLPQIARRCHARPFCSFPVDDRFLGNPCPSDRKLSKYLSIIFVCVNEEVFSEAAIRGQMEKMAELERELDKRRNHNHSSSSSTLQPNQQLSLRQHPLMIRHPMKSAQWEGAEESVDYGIEEEEAKDDEGGGRRGMRRKFKEAEEDEEASRKEEYERHEEELKANQKHKEEEEEGDSLWETMVRILNDHKSRTLFGALLLITSLLLIILLSICIIIQCRQRAKRRRKRERQRQKAMQREFQRQNSILMMGGGGGRTKCEIGHLLANGGGESSGNGSPVYVDSAAGSNLRLLDSFPPPLLPPPSQSLADIYHGCYVPMGSCGGGSDKSAGSGAGNGSGGGGYYARFDERIGRIGGREGGSGRMPSKLHFYS